MKFTKRSMIISILRSKVRWENLVSQPSPHDAFAFEFSFFRSHSRRFAEPPVSSGEVLLGAPTSSLSELSRKREYLLPMTKKKHTNPKSDKTTPSIAPSSSILIQYSPSNNYDASRVFMHMTYAAKLRNGLGTP